MELGIIEEAADWSSSAQCWSAAASFAANAGGDAPGTFVNDALIAYVASDGMNVIAGEKHFCCCWTARLKYKSSVVGILLGNVVELMTHEYAPELW